MTIRTKRDNRLRELKQSLLGRIARLALTRKETGLDGLAKRMLNKQVGEAEHDPELDHPSDWDKPID